MNAQRKPQPVTPTDISGRADRARITLSLDIKQRINLAEAIGNQPGETIREIRMLDALMKKIELSEEAREQVGLKAHSNVITWNPEKEFTAEVELSIDEASMLTKIIRQPQRFRGFDSKWLLPIVEALDIKE
jgi:hypothetical protein